MKVNYCIDTKIAYSNIMSIYNFASDAFDVALDYTEVTNKEEISSYFNRPIGSDIASDAEFEKKIAVSTFKSLNKSETNPVKVMVNHGIAKATTEGIRYFRIQNQYAKGDLNEDEYQKHLEKNKVAQAVDRAKMVVEQGLKSTKYGEAILEGARVAWSVVPDEVKKNIRKKTQSTISKVAEKAWDKLTEMKAKGERLPDLISQKAKQCYDRLTNTKIDKVVNHPIVKTLFNAFLSGGKSSKKQSLKERIFSIR